MQLKGNLWRLWPPECHLTNTRLLSVCRGRNEKHNQEKQARKRLRATNVDVNDADFKKTWNLKNRSFSTFDSPCIHCFRTLRKAKRSQANVWTWATPLAGESFSLCGGFGNTTQLPFCFCFVERNWRASSLQGGSEVGCRDNRAFFFFFKNTNTRQMEINFSSLRSQDIFQLHSQRDYKYRCYSSYYSVITGRSVCGEKCSFFILQDCKSFLSRANERTVGTEAGPADSTDWY